MKRILLTGASGFIGRALARRLGEEGVAVHAVLRPKSDCARLAGLPGLIPHVYDGSAGMLTAILAEARPDVVFHLAGKYVREHTDGNISELIRDNVLFGAELLEAMRGASARQLIYTASYFQHADGVSYSPLNLYAAIKQAFEDTLAYYVKADGLLGTGLVFFDIYGEGDWRRRLIPAIEAALATGTPVPLPAANPQLYLVHVDDAVQALMAAATLLLEHPGEAAGQRFAVAPDRGHALNEVLALFEQIAGRPVPIARGAFPAPARTIARPWAGPRLPGWQPRVPLEVGIRRLLSKA